MAHLDMDQHLPQQQSMGKGFSQFHVAVQQIYILYTHSLPVA